MGKPYLQLKVFIGLYIPFLAWVVYNHLAGNWPGTDIFSLAIFAAIVGVPIYHIGAALWLILGNHIRKYELIKVAPIVALLVGVPWYFGYLTHIFILLFITGCFYLFVWNHRMFQYFREVVIDQLKEMGILRKNYIMRWWEELIINLVFMLIAFFLVWLSVFEGVDLFGDFDTSCDNWYETC